MAATPELAEFSPLPIQVDLRISGRSDESGYHRVTGDDGGTLDQNARVLTPMLQDAINGIKELGQPSRPDFDPANPPYVESGFLSRAMTPAELAIVLEAPNLERYFPPKNIQSPLAPSKVRSARMRSLKAQPAQRARELRADA